MHIKAQATPGPWHRTHLRTNAAAGSHNGCDIGAENGANVAIVLHEPLDATEAETIATADLIAAAPDALAFAEAFIKQWNACGPNSTFGTIFNGLRNQALGVVAKARGEDDPQVEAICAKLTKEQREELSLIRGEDRGFMARGDQANLTSIGLAQPPHNSMGHYRLTELGFSVRKALQG